VRQIEAATGGGPPGSRYSDQPNRSPWIAQLAPDGPPRPLGGDASADVAIVGAGIAGVATAFFTLRATTDRVILIERDRVARGATGRNAGQLTTYFERPLFQIADEFGAEMAIDGQRAFDDANDLLDVMTAESGASVRVDRFTGHMGMFSLSHLEVHLRNNLVRRQGGLREEPCVVSEDAEFLDQIPSEFASFYTVVPQATIRRLLETDDDRYRAVLSDRKGCINSGLLVQQVLAFLERRYPDRFRYVDHTLVDRIVVGAGRGVVLHALGHAISTSRAVLCTNGFVDHTVEDLDGRPIQLHEDQRVTGRVGYMAAFAEEQPRTEAAMSYIRNTAIGGDTPYVYVTRRTYERPAGTVTLTCMGGPEHAIDGQWHADQLFPGVMLSTMDETVRPFARAERPAHLEYDFQWHGLMGYMDGGVRVIGEHPRHSGLLYNLGCNGVGFLPSICGGERVSRILAGERLSPSIFDPR
jgi:glycine/D-amino acid oxidase-like deaminating enzyme